MMVYTWTPLKGPPSGHGRKHPVSKKRKTVAKTPKGAKKKRVTSAGRAPIKRSNQTLQVFV